MVTAFLGVRLVTGESRSGGRYPPPEIERLYTLEDQLLSRFLGRDEEASWQLPRTSMGSYQEGGCLTTRKLPRRSYTLGQQKQMQIDRLNKA